MALSRLPSAALHQAMRLLGPAQADEMAIRQAAWVARCEAAPLTPDALTALAATLHQDRVQRGTVVFHGGRPASGVRIVQQGRVELSVGSGRRRTIVHVLRPGDVDGDIQLLLDMPLPYTARVLDNATLLSLTPADYEHLLATSLPIARRWLSSPAPGRQPDATTRPARPHPHRTDRRTAARRVRRQPGTASATHPGRDARRPTPTRSSRNSNAKDSSACATPPSTSSTRTLGQTHRMISTAVVEGVTVR